MSLKGVSVFHFCVNISGENRWLRQVAGSTTTPIGGDRPTPYQHKLSIYFDTKKSAPLRSVAGAHLNIRPVFFSSFHLPTNHNFLFMVNMHNSCIYGDNVKHTNVYCRMEKHLEYFYPSRHRPVAATSIENILAIVVVTTNRFCLSRLYLCDIFCLLARWTLSGWPLRIEIVLRFFTRKVLPASLTLSIGQGGWFQQLCIRTLFFCFCLFLLVFNR